MNVNYMMEIIALDDWELTHPLGATAYKVLRKLYHLAYKERFPERISVPNTVMMSLVGCSEDSLDRARKALMNYGRIGYSGKKKQTGVYTIFYLTDNPGHNPQNAGIDTGNNGGYDQGINRGYAKGDGWGSYRERDRETGEPRDEECGVQEKGGSARVREALFPARTRVLTAAERPCYDGLWALFSSAPLYDGYRNRLLRVLDSDRFSLDLILTAHEKTEKRHRRNPMDNPGAYLMTLLFDWEERGLRTVDDVMDSKDEWVVRA